MGTKAIFQVNGSDKVLGMTYDGTQDNLEWLAWMVMRTAERLNCLEEFRNKQTDAVESVLAGVEEETKGWCFISSVGEANWIDNSAFFRQENGILELYEGKFNYGVKRLKILTTEETQDLYARDREEHLRGCAFTD